MNKREALTLTIIQWTLILAPIAALMLEITIVLFDWPIQLPEGIRDFISWYVPF